MNNCKLKARKLKGSVFLLTVISIFMMLAIVISVLAYVSYENITFSKMEYTSYKKANLQSEAQAIRYSLMKEGSLRKEDMTQATTTPSFDDGNYYNYVFEVSYEFQGESKKLDYLHAHFESDSDTATDYYFSLTASQLVYNVFMDSGFTIDNAYFES